MNTLRASLFCAALAASGTVHAGDPVPDALALDPAFDGATSLEQPGMAFYNDLRSANRNDFAMAVFPATDGDHWLVGQHVDPAHVPSNTVLIARIAEDGSHVAGFGDGGQAVFDVLGPNGEGVAVATKAPDSDTFYFAGPVKRASAPDQHDVGVSCASADGTPCANFGDGGTVVYPVGDAEYTQAVGIAVNEAGQVIVVGGCKIAGTTSILGNLDICVLALDGSGGAPVDDFGTGGMSRVGIDLVEDGWEIPTDGTPVLLTSSDSSLGNRIFIAGGIQVTPFSEDVFAMFDDRAFVLALDGHTGLPDPTFGDDGLVIVQDDGNPSYVTALNTLPDGNLLLAGNVAYDPTTDTRVLLAELAPDGTPLPTFCGGDVCIGNPDGIPRAIPRAVAVRPASGGDIVVGTEINLAPDTPPLQAAWEANASGTAWRSARILDYTAAPDQLPQGSVKRLFIDAQNRVWMLGERRWTVDETQPVDSFDITLTRMVDGDTIFGAGFEE